MGWGVRGCFLSYFVSLKIKGTRRRKYTYSTRRFLSPVKSALVILVRLFAFRSLGRNRQREGLSGCYIDTLIKQGQSR